MLSDDAGFSVKELQAKGILLVEDGNHGESRPRPSEFDPDGEVAFIRASDMADGRVRFPTADRINSIARNRITKGIGKPGDILFSHKGTVGKLALIPPDAPPFVCSPQTTFWRTLDDEVLDRRFLYAFMRSRLFREQWRSRKGETDMADYVSLTAQRGFRVPLPSIGDQRAIGDMIGPIDQREVVNAEYGALLHLFAERLFRAWFVDFEPLPDDASVANGSSPIGAVRKLLPVDWDESKVGDIPKGWTLAPLDEIAMFHNGAAMQKYPPTGANSLPVLKIAQLRDGRLDNADRASPDLPPDLLINNGDVVFSWSGTLLVRIWTGGRAALNQHLFKVTSEKFPRWFFYFWTRAHLPEFQAVAADKKTTMGHIKRHHLSDAVVVVPSPDVMEAADNVFDPLLERMVASELHSQHLDALREVLLRSVLRHDQDLDGLSQETSR